MAPITHPSHLANSLATSAQLETSASQLDGVPADLEASIRFSTAQLLQAAGILLRLPQALIAQSIVLLYRFWIGPDGGSMLDHDASDVAAAALYLTAKPSSKPLTPRQILTVFEYLLHVRHTNYAAVAARRETLDDINTHLSEGQYESGRDRLYQTEAQILRVLGFQTQVALPYTLCINYLQTLDVLDTPPGSTVAKRAFAHLNSALFNPQLLHLTHQPSAIATAAIYLAAREVSVKLPETEWWEVFDVDREELGFVVVALLSVEGFVSAERQMWAQRKTPMTVAGIRTELERRGAVPEQGE